MYRVALSHAQLKGYLASMITDELILYNQETQRYTQAPKGYKFIKQYDELSKLVPEIKSRYYL